MTTCIAEHDTMTEGVMRRCAKPQWRGTDYCYQHAIANGAAVVVTPLMLSVALNGAPVHDTKSLAVHVWTRLLEWKR